MALRRAVRSEIRRRGLWQSSPRYLGVLGWERWAAGGGDGSGDPLDEVTLDVYEFIFIERLQSLRAQLKVKPQIEGLVFRNIRNFLHERQKRSDPLGFRVFEVVRKALRQLVEQGELEVVEGDRRIRGETWLSFDGSGPDETPGALDALDAPVRAWADTLLPDLLTARGRTATAVVRRTADAVLQLAEQGFAAFTARSVVEPLKAEVRSRWVALFDDSLGETGYEERDGVVTVVRQVAEEDRVEAEDRYEKLVRGVSAALAEHDGDDRTTEYLTRLWHFSTAFAADEIADAGDRPLSQRRIARELGIPRERLPGLYATLGQIVERCAASPNPVQPPLDRRQGDLER